MDNNKFYFSYSSLVKLLNNPKQFYKEYILKEREDKDFKYLKEGQLFHLFVLEPQNFDEKFILSHKTLPTGYALATVNKLFADIIKFQVPNEDGKINPDFKIGTLSDYQNEILSILKENNWYQSLKTDQQRLDKVITEDSVSYFKITSESFLYKKTIVDPDMMETARKKAEAVLSLPEAVNLLKVNSSKETVRTELDLKYDLPNYSYGLRGIIDLVKIDYATETIYITDLKTTSKSLLDWANDFSSSSYMYWLQVILYKELILSLVPSGSKKAWKLKVNFIVVDQTNAAYVFPVSTKSLFEWQKKTKEKLDIAQWHYANEKYDLPFELSKGTFEL